MIDYELLLMLDPDLSDEKQGEVVARVRDLIDRGGGAVVRHDAWGKRKLAYEIDKKSDGIYHLLHLRAGAETLGEVSRVLKIDDAVMRHLATRRPEGGPGEALPVAAVPVQDVRDDEPDAEEDE